MPRLPAPPDDVGDSVFPIPTEDEEAILHGTAISGGIRRAGTPVSSPQDIAGAGSGIPPYGSGFRSYHERTGDAAVPIRVAMRGCAWNFLQSRAEQTKIPAPHESSQVIMFNKTGCMVHEIGSDGPNLYQEP
jgi:hypothetical protein